MNASNGTCSDDTTWSAGVVIHADAGWCRKRARRVLLRGCGIFAFFYAVIAIEVWLDILDLRSELTGTVCGLAFGMLVLMGVVLTMVYRWCFRNVIVLSPRQLWVGSAMDGSQTIALDNVAALTIQRDEKHKCWILRNASVPRPAVRVSIEAYPFLCQQIEDFRSPVLPQRI